MKLPHKALIIFSLLLCALMAMLQSCTYEKKLAKWCARCPTHDSTVVEIRETIKDTTIYLPDDEALATALIECDSHYRVIVTELYDSLGRFAKVDLSINPHLNPSKSGSLKYRVVSRCNVDSAGVYFAWKQNDTTTRKATSILVPTYIEKKLTWWEKFKIEYGGWSMGAWLAVLIFIILRIVWWGFKTFTAQGAVVNAGTTALGWAAKLFGRR